MTSLLHQFEKIYSFYSLGSSEFSNFLMIYPVTIIYYLLGTISKDLISFTELLFKIPTCLAIAVAVDA